MRIEVAKVIAEAASEMNLDVRVDDSYSGRGMYGSTTAALIVDNDTDLLRSVAIAAGMIAEDEESYKERGLSLEEFVEDLAFTRDRMGYSTVVY